MVYEKFWSENPLIAKNKTGNLEIGKRRFEDI